MEKRGARTLFLEMNHHKDIACVPQGLLSADYHTCTAQETDNLRLENYDYIVADLGTNVTGEIHGASLEVRGLFIGSGAFWKKKHFCQTAKTLKALRPEVPWHGLLSLGSKEEALSLSQKLSLPVKALGWQPLNEPLTPCGEDLFCSILQGGHHA